MEEIFWEHFYWRHILRDLSQLLFWLHNPSVLYNCLMSFTAHFSPNRTQEDRNRWIQMNLGEKPCFYVDRAIWLLYQIVKHRYTGHWFQISPGRLLLSNTHVNPIQDLWIARQERFWLSYRDNYVLSVIVEYSYGHWNTP